LRKISKTRKLAERVADLESRLSTDSPTADLTTGEPAMDKLLALAFQSRGDTRDDHDSGESGTGKTFWRAPFTSAVHRRTTPS